MKPWLFSFAVLFVLAKAILWIKSFILPMPVYIVAGAFLAIASNYDGGISSFLKPNPTSTENKVVMQTASLVEETPLLQAQEE